MSEATKQGKPFLQRTPEEKLASFALGEKYYKGDFVKIVIMPHPLYIKGIKDSTTQLKMKNESNKMMCDPSTLFNQVIKSFKKVISKDEKETMLLYVSNKVIKASQTVKEVADKSIDKKDNILYLHYAPIESMG